MLGGSRWRKTMRMGHRGDLWSRPGRDMPYFYSHGIGQNLITWSPNHRMLGRREGLTGIRKYSPHWIDDAQLVRLQRGKLLTRIELESKPRDPRRKSQLPSAAESQKPRASLGWCSWFSDIPSSVIGRVPSWETQ